MISLLQHDVTRGMLIGLTRSCSFNPCTVCIMTTTLWGRSSSDGRKLKTCTLTKLLFSTTIFYLIELKLFLRISAKKVKYSRHSPYSINERMVPELIPILGSKPAGDVSHKPGGRLLLLFAHHCCLVYSRLIINFRSVTEACRALMRWLFTKQPHSRHYSDWARFERHHWVQLVPISCSSARTVPLQSFVGPSRSILCGHV